MLSCNNNIMYGIGIQEGEADVTCDRGNGKLTKGSCVLIKAGETYVIVY